MKIPKEAKFVIEREFPGWKPEVLWKHFNEEKRKEAKKLRKGVVREGSACEVCGYSFSPILQIHHIVPIALGGNNSKDNIACLCPNCHKEIHYIYSLAIKGDDENYKKAEEFLNNKAMQSDADMSGYIRRLEIVNKYLREAMWH